MIMSTPTHIIIIMAAMVYADSSQIVLSWPSLFYTVYYTSCTPVAPCVWLALCRIYCCDTDGPLHHSSVHSLTWHLLQLWSL